MVARAGADELSGHGEVRPGAGLTSRGEGVFEGAEVDPAALPAAELAELFTLLREHTGHDFSQYKRSTVGRRLGRRMATLGLSHLAHYVAELAGSPAERDALFRDLLIGVTRFFRDPEAFAALEEHVLPELLPSGSAGGGVRVWVPACSTGEEAYSLAILLQERLDALRQSRRIQVFATDIDRVAIEHARAGIYPASIAADVSPERLQRYFVEEPEGGYRVQKRLRDLLVFSEQDMLRDPPFSRLDLLSCRNALIYLEADLQRRLLPVLHYALLPGRFLLLGSAETVGEQTELFTPVDRKAKLYRRRDDVAGAHPAPPSGLAVPRPGVDAAARQQSKRAGDEALSLRERTERLLLRDVAPPTALVDARGDILYLHGRMGRCLEPAPGEASLNILRMAREELRCDLALALREAALARRIVRRASTTVGMSGGAAVVTVTVRPVPESVDAAEERCHFLVTLEESPADLGSVPLADVPPLSGAEARVAALELSLRAKDLQLQTAYEELESSNEELRSSNEEMQSVNEELQSVNEELETSKEELQSVNEELATVNAELERKVTDLSRANNDLNNLFASTGIGILFLDERLRVQRFTPAVTEVINLIPSDIGRPVAHIVSNMVRYDRLVRDAQTVLATLRPIEVDVQTLSDARYLLSIRPYRTLENAVDGVVITFTEMTETRRAALQR